MAARPSRRGVHRAHESGAAAVEAALVISVLIPLILALVEFGRAFHAYDTLVRSVQAAARHLSIGDADSDRQLESRCIVVTGLPEHSGGACVRPAQLPGLTTGMVTILVPPDPSVTNLQTGAGTGTMSLVAVSINGYVLPGVTSFLPTPLTLGTISATVPFIFF